MLCRPATPIENALTEEARVVSTQDFFENAINMSLVIHVEVFLQQVASPQSFVSLRCLN
jgi:hypothetical protein